MKAYNTKHLVRKESRSTPTDSDPKNTRHFDRVNNNFLSNSREVFNAWNPDKSKIFIYLKAIYDRLAKQSNMAKPEPLLLELIPIDPNEQGEYVDVSKLEKHGNKPIHT